jgi:Flp pilus assembly pilin Flp
MARTAAASGIRIEYGLIAAGIAVAIIAAVNGLGSQVKATFGSVSTFKVVMIILPKSDSNTDEKPPVPWFAVSSAAIRRASSRVSRTTGP